MNQFKRRVLLCVLLSLILSACGIKGPLYIPEKRYPQPTSMRLDAPHSSSYQS